MAIIMALVLVICATPSVLVQASSDVCFISVNDRLLELSSQALSINGNWYVPGSVFGEFGIYSSYFSSSDTLMLFTSDQQYLFDLTNGITYDKDDNHFNVSGYSRNGVPYVPIGFVCQAFGLGWSYIAGNGYGDICRIKDGSAVLQDAQFLSAASDMMKTRYTNYKGTSEKDNGNTNQTQIEGALIYLGFRGVPSDNLLSQISAQKYPATFFVDENEILQEQDRIRELIGKGYSIGINCSNYDEYRNASESLFEVAHVKTLLISSDANEDAVITMASQNGLIFCGYDADGIQDGKGMDNVALVTAKINSYSDGCYARILCNDRSAATFSYLARFVVNNKCSVMAINEITHG